MSAVVVIDGNAEGAVDAAAKTAASLRGAATAANVADTAFVEAANSADSLSIKAVGLDSAMSIVSRGANFARESIEAMFRGSAEGAAAWDAIEMKGRAVYGVFGEILLGTEDVSEAGEVLVEVLDDAVEVLRLLGNVVQPVATVFRVVLGGALSVVADVARVFRGEAQGAADDMAAMGDAAAQTAGQMDALTTATNNVFGRTTRGQAEQAFEALDEYERALSDSIATRIIAARLPSVFAAAENDAAVASQLADNIDRLSTAIRTGGTQARVYFDEVGAGGEAFSDTLAIGRDFLSLQQSLREDYIVGADELATYNQLVAEQQAAEEAYLSSIAPAREQAAEANNAAATAARELTADEMKLAAVAQSVALAFANAQARKRAEYEATAEAARTAAEAEADAAAYLLEKRKELSEASYARDAGPQTDVASQLDAIAEVTNSRMDAIARASADAVVAMATTEERATKVLAKFAGDRLILAGAEALWKGTIGAFFGNPAAPGQIGVGAGAIAAGRAIGGTISAGGGRGAGAAPQNVTNVTQSMSFVFDRGTRASDANAIAGAVSHALRTGAIDAQRMSR